MIAVCLWWHWIASENSEAYDKRVAEAQQKAGVQSETVQNPTVNIPQEHVQNMNTQEAINSQIETLKKLKELLDMGVLTQEEFELKKQQVLNS